MRRIAGGAIRTRLLCPPLDDLRMAAAMEICPACNSRDLINIMLAPAGRKMRFNTCRSCEHKWWTDGEVAVEIGLKDVLAQVAGS